MRALLFPLAVSLFVLACDDPASRTTTTSAPASSTNATEDLKQAGRDLGAAAQKAAGQAANEAKREARNLDVKVTTSLDAGH